MLSSRSASPTDIQQSAGPLRRLLPASADGAKASRDKPASRSAASSATGSSPPVPARRKRGQATTAACGACRKRKSKCDGERPKCSICRDRGTTCEFDTNAAETHTQALKRKFSELQKQKSAFEEIYDVLQTRPDKEAEEVFQRIRRGADASSILRHVNYGDVLVQLALVPEARYRYEFPYLPEMPPFLRRPDNPYLDSEVYECALRGPPGPPGAPRPQYQLPSSSGNGMNGTLSTYGPGLRDPYLKPYLSATVVHPWLDSVKPSRWTTISSDDALMRKILHDYFLFESDWFPFIHKDYFLQDMATEQQRFCTPLLVNSLLCLGCFAHRGLRGRAEFWNPKNVGYQFLAESKRIFEIESELERPPGLPDDPYWGARHREWETRRLTTIQAALIITLIYDLNGSDKIGWRYTVRAIEMADEIQLLGPPMAHHGPEVQCVRTYTAWALFCWQSLQSYHYIKPPIIKEPPKAPLPDPREQPQWYGELWIKYPLTQSRLPTYHGLLFKAKADFWTIITEFLLLTLPHHRATTRLPVHQAFSFYDRLRAWLEGLPEPLTPKKIVLPHQLKLHMHYHILVMDFFSPFLDYNGTDGMRLGRTPRELYFEAVTNYETLIRLYYLRHGFEACDSFLIHFLGTLNHLSMNAIESCGNSVYLESHRSTVVLLTKGIYDQSRSHFVARAVLRLQVSLMRPEDFELLRRYVEIDESQLIYGPLEQTVYSDWPVYGTGLEAKAEQWRQGRTWSNSLESLSLGPSTPPLPTRSPA